MTLRFDRHEIAGSLGDLGTLLPLALGLILLCGLDATATFFGIGLFYVFSGLYFGLPMPVQPMKVISAYAVANAMGASQVSAAGLWMGALLLLLGLTGTITLVRKVVPYAVVRGVQLTTGVLLFIQGIKLLIGQSALQLAKGSAEPFLSAASLGPIPIGLVLGAVAVVVILLLRENRVAPAALVVVLGGAVAGLLLGGGHNLADFQIGLHWPEPLPFGVPSASDLVIALTALALPQIPMTLGNAVVAQADLTKEYFGDEAAGPSTPRALSISMGLANLAAGLFGAMPMCHGAGGLAAHYRFGARTAGSNLIIGALFLLAGLLVGDQAVDLFSVMPFGVLGALLCFAAIQLGLTVRDVKSPRAFVIVGAILVVSLATSLGIGFGIGIVAAYLLKFTKKKA